MNAQQNLEVGLSYNFEVRDHPLFHLINAKVQKDQGLDHLISTGRQMTNLVSNFEYL